MKSRQKRRKLDKKEEKERRKKEKRKKKEKERRKKEEEKKEKENECPLDSPPWGKYKRAGYFAMLKDGKFGELHHSSELPLLFFAYDITFSTAQCQTPLSFFLFFFFWFRMHTIFQSDVSWLMFPDDQLD